MSKPFKDFRTWDISFRSARSFHQYHTDEGITKELIIEKLRNASEIRRDPRKLRKRIILWHITESVTNCIRLTVIFQLFPHEKRIHVLNAYLGSFHTKNLFEKMGLKGVVPKKVEKK